MHMLLRVVDMHMLLQHVAPYAAGKAGCSKAIMCTTRGSRHRHSSGSSGSSGASRCVPLLLSCTHAPQQPAQPAAL